jgi:two-component system, NarL family, invasion response regulator UvrY
MDSPDPLSSIAAAGLPQQPELPLQDPQALSILLVDDHSIVRNGLKEILASKFPNARFGEGRDAREALEQVAQRPWTLVLLDISIPGQSGLEVLKQMKVLRPETKVLVFTMHPENQYALRALKAGACGYLTKENAVTTVVEAVTKVLQGGKFVSPALAEMLVSGLHGPAEKALYEGLSDREYQVLRMLGLGRSVKEIGFELSLSVKTVSTYRIRVLKKLGLKSNADVIRYALREKLVE